MPFSQLSSPPPIDDDTYCSSRLLDPVSNLGSDDAPLLAANSAEPSLLHLDDPIVSDAWMASFLDIPHADFVLFPDVESSSPVSDVQDGQATPMSETIPTSSISPTSAQTEETLSDSVADLLPRNQTWQPHSGGLTDNDQPDNAGKHRGETRPAEALLFESKGCKPVRRRCRRRPPKPSGSQYQQHIVNEQRYRQSVKQALRGLQAALPDTGTPSVAAPLERREDGDEDDGETTKVKKKRRKGKPAIQKPFKATKATVISRALAYIEQLDREYLEWEAQNTRVLSLIVQHHWVLVNKPLNTFTI